MLIVYIATILAVFPGRIFGHEWDALLVNFPKYLNYPVTVSEAKGQQWVLASSDSGLNVDVYWKGTDFTYMILFDKKGSLAGLRLGIPVTGIDAQTNTNKVTFTYSYDKLPLYSKQKKTAVYPQDFWYSDVLFQSPDNLKKGGRASLERGTDDVALGVFIKLGGNWTELSRQESGIIGQGFVKHKCYAGMGQHYFYGVTSQSDCTKMQGVFAGYEGGKLVLVGMYGFGVISHQPSPFEVVKKPVAEMMFSTNRPACLDNNVDSFGAFSSHIYLVSRGAEIACPASG